MSRIFGPIRQNGYVVRDLKAAMRHWSEVMGVGPWFVADPAPLHDFRYRGEPSGCVVALALANAGPLQIELIEQLNDGPSLYKDFLDAGLEGLQHVAFWTTRYDDEVARAESLGFRIGHSGETGGAGRFAYFETTGHPGTVVEISETLEGKQRLFARVREASQGWDGSDPIRPLTTR